MGEVLQFEKDAADLFLLPWNYLLLCAAFAKVDILVT